MPKALSPSHRSELRAKAHKLDPVVIIGDKGLTDEVVAEIDRSLKAHELIKVRAAADDRKLREEWMGAICARLEAHPVQQIGKVLVIYRENPDKKPQPKSPPPQAPSRRRPRQEAIRTSRPRSRTPSPRPESGPRRRRPRTSR
jgi:putative YhbY family RNA-binding protein